MKNFTKLSLSALLLFLTIQLFAQNHLQSNPSLFNNVIEKITTNPATGFETNFEKFGDPENGSAIFYLQPYYFGKVKEIVFHTGGLDVLPEYNPIRIINAQRTRVEIPRLRKNYYEILEIHLIDGQILKGDGTLFIVYSANKEEIPLQGKVTDYTINMEGNHIEIFNSVFAEANPESLKKNSSNSTSENLNAPINDGAKVADASCNPNLWSITKRDVNGTSGHFLIKPTCPGPNGGPSYHFYCIQHYDSNIPGLMQYVSGSIGSGNVVLRSLGGAGQRVSMQGCILTISASGGSGCAGSNITLSASGANNYSWSNGATGSSITVSPFSTTTYTATGTTGQCRNTATATATIVAAPSGIGATTNPPTCTVSTATITINAISGASYSFDNGATYQSSNVKSGLFSNTNYFLKVKNSTGCESGTFVQYSGAAKPPPGTPTANITPASCTVPATITIAAAAGATYSFDNGVTYQASNIKSNAAANTTYTIKIKNSNGCISSSINITTGTAPTIPSMPIADTPAQPTCTVANGSFTITNYNASFTYTFSPAGVTASGNSFTAPTGTYTVTAKNGTCTSGASANIVINPRPSSPATPISSTPIQPTCAVATGTFSLSNYNAAFTYAFTPANVTGSNNIFTAPAGTYTVIATSGACSSPASASIIISSQPVTPSAPNLLKTDPTCTVTSGSISVSSATAGLTFSFDGGVYSATSSWSGLGASSSHTVNSKNTQGCISANTSVAIGALVPAPSAPALLKLDPTCTVSTGSINVSSTTAGFMFSFDGGAYSSISSWSKLVAGSSHTVSQQNTAGCISAATGIAIAMEPSSPSAPVLASTPSTCGSVSGTLSVSSVTTGLLFSLDGGAYGAATSWSALAASSTHTVSAQSAAGCSGAATSAVMSPAGTTISVAVTSNQQACSTGATTLTATATVSSMTVGSSVAYSWMSGSATGPVVGTGSTLTISPLAATNYFVTATYGGCSDTKSVLVQSPRPSLILTSVITICKGNTQDVIADNNGIAGYTYRWLAPAVVLNRTTPTLVAMKPAVTTNYTVERTTPNGCKDTATSTIKVFEQPVIGGLSKKDASCIGGNDGNITIDATSISGLVLEYSIDGNNWSTTNTFSNLAPGSYSILVRNQNGICQAVTGSNITLGRVSGPQDTIKGQSVTCALENVQFVADPASVGATYSWSATGNPVIIGGNTNTTFVANWSVPGVYQITMTVTLNGCSTVRTKSINVSNAVNVDAGADKFICAGGITRIGTTPPANVQVAYSWSPATGLNDPSVAQPTALPLRTTTYTLTVTNPVTGCVRSDDVTVNVDVTRNPHADAGGPKSFSDVAGTQVSIGGPTTSPDPFQGSRVDYLWYGLVTDVAGNNLADNYAPITNFIVPNGAAASYTYVLDVRKIVPAGTENGNPIFQYCHSYDTVVLSKTTAQIVTISGSLWDNTNGDNNIDAAAPLNEFRTNGGKTVYAVLTDNAGKVIGTTLIADNGAYLFTGVPQNTTGLKVLISTLAPSIGTTFTTPVTPVNWVYLGSQSGSINSNKDKGNGYVSVNTGALNITGVNIGFDQLPVPVGATLALQNHPAPNNPFVVNPVNFTGTDAEDGTNINLVPTDSIRYTVYPVNIDSVKINGIIYKSTNWPATGVTVVVNTPVSVYPVAGNVTVDMAFKVIDQAGQQSPLTAHVLIPFKVVPYPDLTPVIDLPSNLFAAGETKNVVVYLQEILNFATSNGTVVFRFTVPPGYELQPYNVALTSLAPTGGVLTNVTNDKWSVVGAQNGRSINLKAIPGIGIAGGGVTFIGFKIKRTTILPNSVSNIVMNIFADPSGTYDTNTANNLYNRVIISR